MNSARYSVAISPIELVALRIVEEKQAGLHVQQRNGLVENLLEQRRRVHLCVQLERNGVQALQFGGAAAEAGFTGAAIRPARGPWRLAPHVAR